MKLLILMLVSVALGAEEAKEEEPKEFFEMKIPQGTLKGFKEKSLNGREFFSFLGLPFAKPPLGELRFKDPLPADPWTGTLEADKPPEICPQFDFMQILSSNFSIVGGEDCLYLNVHTPKPNELDAKLPVMVFIHGGGFSLGSAKEYTANVLLNENIVLVVIQYRISVLGFLSTGDSVISGNYGMKDQVMALKWIQKNVENFGGDPDRVTIFGESAGAGSAHLLLLSPMAKGLFHGAISQSGVATCPWSITRNARQVAQKFGQMIECPLEEDSKEFLECLLQKDAVKMIEVTGKLFEWGCTPMSWLPTVDGDFMPEDPLILLSEKRYNKVNFISGIAKDEGIISVAGIPPDLKDQLISNFDKNGPLSLTLHQEKDGVTLARKYYDHYLEGKKLTNESFSTLKDMFTDRYFSVCHDIATKFHSEDTEMKTYRYQLDWRGQISLLTLMNITDYPDSVCHGDDLFYLFDGGSIFVTPMESSQDLKLREIFVKLWTNFATTGNPTPDDSLGFLWSPATPSQFHYLSLVPEPFMSEYVNTKARDFYESLPLRENLILRRHSSTQSNDEL